MSKSKSQSSIARRELFAIAGVSAALLAAREASAQPKAKGPPASPHAQHGKPAKDAPPLAPASAALNAIIDSTASCLREGRYCLARCTEHLAAGSPMMAECQRSVMNMLAVTEAMAEVAGYRNASSKQIKALATACATFCRTCADACEPHKDHHAECKACMDACVTCAKACEAYTA